MTQTPEPHSQTVPEYQVGYWYNLYGHDWQYAQPLPIPSSEGGQSEGQSLIPESALHYVCLCVEYGAIDEPPADEGILATFGYLLRSYLRSTVNAERFPEEAEETVTGEVPQIDVRVGKSLFEIEVSGTEIAQIAYVWEKLAEVFHSPNIIYHADQLVMGGQAAELVRETQVMLTALQKRHEVYTGTLWHNDLFIRTGLNGATLAPLDITHVPHRVHPAITRLAAHLNPSGGKTRHTFQATDPALMGVGFRQPPAPMDIEDFLDNAPELAYSQAGSLETDDGQALISTVFPVTPSGFIASDAFGQIVAQLLREVTGDRTELRGEVYLRGDHLVLTLAIAGDWSVEDARAVVATMYGVQSTDSFPAKDEDEAHSLPPRIPAYSEECLPDHRLAEAIDSYVFSGVPEHILFMRRIENDSPSPELVRDHLKQAFSSAHIPEPLARGELAVLFPPLLPEHLFMGRYGSGQGAAFPPSLEVEDISRSFHAVEGQHFACRIPSKPGEFAFFAPHRLTVSDDFIVQEWYEDTRPQSALCRRIALAWGEVRAWVSIGEAIALVDHAGRALFVIPTLYDRVGELYDALGEFERRVARQGAVVARGGEYELREIVRGVVAQQVAYEIRVKAETEQNSLPSNGNPMKATKGTLKQKAEPPHTKALLLLLWGVLIVVMSIIGNDVLTFFGVTGTETTSEISPQSMAEIIQKFDTRQSFIDETVSEVLREMAAHAQSQQ